MTKNFFNILSDVLQKNSGGTMHLEPGFKTDFSTFMLIRYLSMKESLLPFATILNNFQYKTLTPEQIYLWAYNHVPRQRSGYIQYIKKAKTKKKKK